MAAQTKTTNRPNGSRHETEAVGGLVLIAIGLKILLEHWLQGKEP